MEYAAREPFNMFRGVRDVIVYDANAADTYASTPPLPLFAGNRNQ